MPTETDVRRRLRRVKDPELNLDLVVLGPLRDTPTHPAARTLGWERFSSLVAHYPLPVYALGGLRVADLQEAWRAGAHGIAGIRGVWEG